MTHCWLRRAANHTGSERSAEADKRHLSKSIMIFTDFKYIMKLVIYRDWCISIKTWGCHRNIASWRRLFPCTFRLGRRPRTGSKGWSDWQPITERRFIDTILSYWTILSITIERVNLGRRGKLWNEELDKLNNCLHFQIVRVIFNVVNCKFKTYFIYWPVFVPFSPPPNSTPRAFFSVKQRKRALTRGRQLGVVRGGGAKKGAKKKKKNALCLKVLSRVPKTTNKLPSTTNIKL